MFESMESIICFTFYRVINTSEWLLNIIIFKNNSFLFNFYMF